MRTIWLVGASEGIGRALAQELSKSPNHSLILSARNHDRLRDLAQGLRTQPRLIEMDVCDEKSVARAWNMIKAESQIPHTIIYCAGYCF